MILNFRNGFMTLFINKKRDYQTLYLKMVNYSLNLDISGGSKNNVHTLYCPVFFNTLFTAMGYLQYLVSYIISLFVLQQVLHRH